MHYQFRPIDQWPGKRRSPREQKRSPFGAGYARTLVDLDRELRHLNATNIVIQADVREQDVRNDGLLRSDAKVRGAGVILSFESKVGALSYPCDTYSDWQGNLRAIALALAALRAVDRYGVTSRAEQYRGWQALPPPAAARSSPAMTAIEAAALLAAHSSVTNGPILESREWFVTAARQASARTHPDRGGDAEAFKTIQQAIEVLERHHNGGL